MATTLESKRIYLIGLRGVGKTTVGRLLAQRLGLPFFDADVVLEQKTGRTIREVFEKDGEVGFRDLEQKYLEELSELPPAVIATGGGAVLRSANRDRMKRSGKVVWLTAGVETMWQRQLNDPATSAKRPNLSSGGLDEIAQLASQREPLYRACADAEVCTEGRSPEAVVEDILGTC